MLHTKKRFASILLAGTIIISSLAGCSQSGKSDKTSSGASPSSNAGTTGEPSAEFKGYPMETDEKLSIWSFELPNEAYTSAKDSPFHIGIAEKTGVDLEWTFPVRGADLKQAYNLMLVSDDLPDIIYDRLNGEEMINDGYILPLNDIIEKNAPNLSALYKDKPELEKSLKTDKGDYFMFPWLRESDMLRTYLGPVVRKDWLDEQKLPLPQTIDDWTNTLKVFKEKYGATMSVLKAYSAWNVGPWCAYGVMKGYYLEDGKMAYGPAQEGWREALTTMNQWYKDGLLDPDIATLDNPGVQTKVLNDKTGLSFTACSQISNWGTSIKNGVGKGDWVPMPYPVKKAGDPIEFTQQSGMPTNEGAAITKNCKNIELAARFLDWCYSDEGITYWNFGTEGDTYTVVDGVPTFTEKITNNPEGMQNILTCYIGTMGSGFSIQSEEMWKQKSTQAAIDGAALWSSNNNIKEHAIPTLTPTADESAEMSSVQNAINTYTDEMYFKFLFGEESLDKFDSYVETLNSMGLPRVLEVYDQQMDRYNKR